MKNFAKGKEQQGFVYCWLPSAGGEDCRDLLDTILCIQGSFCLNRDALYPTAKHWHVWRHSFRQSYFDGDKHKEVMDKHSFPVNLATHSRL